MPESRLPPGVAVLERGWLSSNNVLLLGDGPAALIDSGYWSHSEQTCALVRHALAGRPLDLLLNTHLHSDHCGGNAALQDAWPGARTWIPPGQAAHVERWNPVVLSYQPTGQYCPPFRFDGLLAPGIEVALGSGRWQVHAAPGHDPHSVILFEAATETLISADALWEDGFGIVFPELDGNEGGFAQVAATLDLIESLRPAVVIPGHGAVFDDAPAALAKARSRLNRLAANPARHASHAVKVLLKFKLLELQRMPLDDFTAWAVGVPYIEQVRQRWFVGTDAASWIGELVAQLVHARAAKCESGFLENA